MAAVDTVLSAIGLRANTALAQAAGLICERGVLVDERLQTSAPGVYALGDGAQYAQGLWGDAADITPRGALTLPFVMPIMSAARAGCHAGRQADARGHSADAGGHQHTGLADCGGCTGTWNTWPVAQGGARYLAF